MSHTSLIECI